MDGDKFSILHTATTTNVIVNTTGWLARNRRKEDLDSKLKAINSGTGYATVGKVEFPCPSCGSTIEGEETQNIFTCSFCGSKIGRDTALRPNSYKIKYVMGRYGEKYVPGRAVPFTVTKAQAIHKILSPINWDQTLSVFTGLDSHVTDALHAFYLPFSLVDWSVRVHTMGFLSGGLYYKEYLNWACPESVLHDVFVTDRLEPWDFSSEMPFEPAFMDGDTRIVAMSNLFNRGDVIDCLMYERLERDIAAVSGKRQDLSQWGQDYRPHHEFVLLPVYWADMRAFADKHICAAVNGQTRKPVVQVLRKSEKDDYFAEGEPSLWKGFSQDSTMINGAVKIKMVGGSMKWARRV